MMPNDDIFLARIEIFTTIEDVRANPRMRYLENLIDTVVCLLCLKYLGILFARTLVCHGIMIICLKCEKMD